MYQILDQARHGKLGVYLQFLVILLIMSAGITYAMAISGCDCDGDGDGGTEVYFDYDIFTTYSQIGQPTFKATITDISPDPMPGETVGRTLGGHNITGMPAPASVTFAYTPPDRVRGLTIWQGGPPDHPDDPPPYIWSNKGPDWKGSITFRVPSMPVGQSEMVLTEILEARLADGSSSAAMVETTITSVPAAGSPISQTTSLGDSDGPSAKIDSMAWHVSPLVQVKGMTMTTGLCQEWLNFLQGGNAFAAVRLPMSPPDPTQSMALPVVFSGECSPTLRIIDTWSGGAVFTVPLEYRFERFAFPANNLPGAPGEHWLVMGVGSLPGLSCPQMGDMGPGRWALNVDACLNLPPNPLVLPIYFCYEGEDQPMLTAQQMAAVKAASFLGADTGITTYQDEGITCVGPRLFHLQLWETAFLSLENSSTALVSPTQTISFYHAVSARPPMTVALSYTSTLGTLWRLYGDRWGEPNLLDPITQPVRADYWTPFWLVTQLPAGTPHGPYTLFVTATSVLSPEVFAPASDLMWVGAWVAPPPPKVYRDIYLPLAYKDAEMPAGAPDLVVESLVATSNSVQVVVRNQGTAPVTDEFWVDVYIDPHPVPTSVNQVWHDLASNGLVWGVTASSLPLASGDAIALTVNDAAYYPERSIMAWPLTAGTPVYAQVDSVNLDTSYGGVLETHEITGGPYNNIASTVSAAALESVAAEAREPGRDPSASGHGLPTR